MGGTVVIPVALFPRLISLASTEVTRQRRIFDEIDEVDWPPDFDAHDIVMLEDVIEGLKAAGATGDETVEFPNWKGMRLLMRLAQEGGIIVVERAQD